MQEKALKELSNHELGFPFHCSKENPNVWPLAVIMEGEFIMVKKTIDAGICIFMKIHVM